MNYIKFCLQSFMTQWIEMVNIVHSETVLFRPGST